jgi:hypothetical protein
MSGNERVMAASGAALLALLAAGPVLAAADDLHPDMKAALEAQADRQLPPPQLPAPGAGTPPAKDVGSNARRGQQAPSGTARSARATAAGQELRNERLRTSYGEGRGPAASPSVRDGRAAARTAAEQAIGKAASDRASEVARRRPAPGPTR